MDIKNKKAYIIVGLGFGDEGKGLCTDYYSRIANNPIVIRYNGGHQAGHTVVSGDGHRHVFSSFGSGTLRGVPTYWSRYCTFCPEYFVSEYQTLPIKPHMLVDELCPVTTPYDIIYNRLIEKHRGDQRHGSCGVGFGATFERSKLDGLNLSVTDLLDNKLLLSKLNRIKEYFQRKTEEDIHDCFHLFEQSTLLNYFMQQVISVRDLIKDGIVQLVSEKDIICDASRWDNYIFEGAQGILLDINYGIAPHITKSNTTSKNALQLLFDIHRTVDLEIEICYVTRVYHTRHGAGPFTVYSPYLQVDNARWETNLDNEFQGEFRKTYLDCDLVNYALACDNKYSHAFKKSLLITCIDQLPSHIVTYIKDGEQRKCGYRELVDKFEANFHTVKYSFSPCADDLY